MEHYWNLYKEYRDYIKHEDALINQRLAWALTVQGFLFASYALVLNKMIEIERCTEAGGRMPILAPLHNQAGLFLVLLCFIGVTICFCAYGSIRAAESAVSAVKETFERMQPASAEGDRFFYRFDHPSPARLPRLTGGGTLFGEVRGRRLASAIPAVIGLVWILSLGATGYAVLKPMACGAGEAQPSPASAPSYPKPRG